MPGFYAIVNSKYSKEILTMGCFTKFYQKTFQNRACYQKPILGETRFTKFTKEKEFTKNLEEGLKNVKFATKWKRHDLCY